MAIQRIERYGQFRPSPINESRVRRMEQLAGFAGGIAQTARAFGEARAAEKAPEKAQAAVQEAIKIDPETGQISFGELQKAKGYGAAYTNTLAVENYTKTGNMFDGTDIYDANMNKFFDDLVELTENGATDNIKNKAISKVQEIDNSKNLYLAP